MCLDMNRERLKDALIGLAVTAQIGRIICIPLASIADAFPVPNGQPGTPTDMLKAKVPGAARSYKWRAEGTELMIERIRP